MPAPSPAPTPAREWAYRACQASGWGVYALVNLVASAAVRSAPGTVQACFVTGCGLTLTHLLRRRITRARWTEHPLRALLPRVLASSVALGALLTLLALLMAVGVLHAFPARETSAATTLVYVFNFSVVMLVWQLLYFAEHSFARSRRAELQRLQLESASREAELRALKAQLNPHFLFNCLNSIRALIAEDPVRAQHVVTLLSGLMRYSLSAASAATVPLARELEVVRDYLELEGVRLEERLRVRIDVPDDCLTVSVPGMLVQSLVENAIKHGVARLKAGGIVEVTARLEDGILNLTVSNSAGLASSPLPTAGTGVGLSNASERLRLLFGRDASLELDCTRPELTETRVRIPAREGA
jgi:two-component system, LytTR family, sensor histidine kinase AlgZ